ncbi:MAG: transcription-repair coupling factor [Victivallales bacterium]|nr:transcription-repair coupling factor [Victivallales bacterium]
MKNDLKKLKNLINSIFNQRKADSIAVKDVDKKVLVPSLLQLPLDFSRPVIFILPDINYAENLVFDFNIWSKLLNINKRILKISEIGDMNHYFPENEKEYISSLYRISRTDFKENNLFSVTAAGCFTPLISPEIFHETYFKLRKGEKIEFHKLLNKLTELDYDNEFETSEPFQFSRRGGIVDVFSPLQEYPARIEFWGDEIDNIRYYSPSSQKTVKIIDSYTLTGRNIIQDTASSYTLLDYFPDEPQKIFIYPEQCRENLKIYSNSGIEKNFVSLINKAYKSNSSYFIFDPFESASCDPKNIERPIVNQLPLDPAGILKDEINFSNRTHCVQARIEQIKQWLNFNYNVFFTTRNDKGIDFLKNWLKENQLSDEKNIYIIKTDFSAGFVLPDNGTVLVTEKELLCFPIKKRTSPTTKMSLYSDSIPESKSSDFRLGDYVVHITYGIGIFRGIKEIKTQNCIKEVIEIEYDNEMKLFVPVWQANLVSRYIGSRKTMPKLSKLGSTRWTKDKAAALRGAKYMATELLQIQAMRSSCEGIKFSEDAIEQEFFEASFPFNETVDQLKANEDVKADMIKKKPMDRLICGDAGYGKTEIAMRAAFRAVMCGRQIAVLVPTTILAQQHYYNFLERFAEFPVNIEMLSRFKTKKEQQEIINKLHTESLDIIIGTHRIIQNDIKLSNLGLLIIDEEQRFGVEHKEKLKKLRATVDVLTLSATPIPRTLYLAMSGIRDLSTIITAPVERHPVQTMVCQFDNKIIKNAINREKRRGGQVFFLHNRVKTIERRYSRLKEEFPEVSFSIAHGQMPENELEEVMERFIMGKTDVLICTTIIESGVDIPNANTIIVERSDRFGLAELYQLRGRVGRWTRQAYAYLLLPEHNIITGKARERLSAVRKYTQLGAGFKLAVKDLEIRGTGNILGSKQSGHINSVGFDLYCQLLKNAVNSLKGKKEINFIPSVDISLDFLEFGTHVNKNKLSACFTDDYIPSEILRIDLYRKLSSAASVSEIESIREEIIDRFGKLNKNAENFLTVMEIKLRLALAGYNSLSFHNDHLFIEGNGGNIFKVNGKIPKLKAGSSREKLLSILKYSRKIC